MDKEVLLYACLMIFGTFISSIAQVLLKKAAMRSYTTKVEEYLNVRVIVSYLIFFSATFLTVIAYNRVPLSMGAVLGTTSYIFITIFGVLIFHEKLDIKKVCALFLIILGIVIYTG